jgi:metal-responsive CopG/Arc/MetJ family transcriptional regulator
MTRVFISLSDDVAERFRALIPFRERSKVVERLLAKELQARESARDDELSEIAKRVETESAFAAVREVSADVNNVAGEAID